MRTISRAQVDATRGYIWSKNWLDYDYGGSGNPGGDCSWFAFAVPAHVQGMKANRRYGSTENCNRPGLYGATAWGDAAQLGLIHVRSKSDVPADALVKLGFMHGGGGYNSHVAGTFDGLNFESRGMYRGRSGHVVSDSARAWNDPLFHDFWYLPVVAGNPDPNAFPLPADCYYGWYEGPEQSVSGRAGEPGYQIDGLARIQQALAVPVTRVYDAATHHAVKAVQERTPGLLPDGFVGPLTWAAIITGGTPMSANEVHEIKQFIVDFCGPIGHDVKRLCAQEGLAINDAGFGDVPGLPQFGDRSRSDVIAAIAQATGVTRTEDKWSVKSPKAGK